MRTRSIAKSKRRKRLNKTSLRRKRKRKPTVKIATQRIYNNSPIGTEVDVEPVKKPPKK